MNPERWARLAQLIDELLDLPEDRRAERVAQITKTDPDLEEALAPLVLENADSSGPLDASLDTYAAAVFDDTEGDPEEDGAAVLAPGTRIGPYRILSEIGRGGMGVVFLAERADGEFELRVALKVVRGGRLDGVERFRHERRVLARLRHPNIASLFDGGALPTGEPYFAMEFVDGEKITTACDRRRLGIDARLELFEDVCRAVHSAHRNLVLHRDLKPGNVFVTSDGLVKLLDFGIAKVIEEEDDDGGTTRQYLTPAYAAPEQVLGQATSTATDIYSLGVLLYEVLTGRNPHGDATKPVELARNVVDRDPPSASSTVRADVAAARGTDARSLRRRLRGDLDNVVAKALHKVPEMRYASAEDLRADLERCRRRLPVSARPATLSYRLTMFARRNRLAAAAIVVAAFATMAGFAGVVWQGRVAARERDAAREEAMRATAVNEYLLDVFEAADPGAEAGPTLTAVQLAERGLETLDDHLQEQPKLRADMTKTLGAVFLKLGEYERADSLLNLALDQFRRDGRDPRVIDTLLNLADVYQWQRRMDECESVLREAAALGEAKLPEGHEATVEARVGLGLALSWQGKYAEADSVLTTSLESVRRMRGDQDPQIADHLTHLGVVRISNGDPAGAAEAYSQALAIRRIEEPNGGVLTARVLSALADVVDDLDRPDDALAMGAEALEMLRREYGPEGHPALAIAMTNQAGTLRRLGHLNEAESMQREIIAMFVRHLGPDHGYVGRAHNNLGVTLRQAGDFAGAEEEYRTAVRICKASFGERHPEIVPNLGNHADALVELGRLEEAEKIFREAISIAEEGGTDGLTKSYSVMGLARVHRLRKQWVECERLNREAWELRKAAVGEGHSVEVAARVEVASVVAERGRLDEARTLLDPAIETARAGGKVMRATLTKALEERAAIARASGEPQDTLDGLEREIAALKAPPSDDASPPLPSTR